MNLHSDKEIEERIKNHYMQKQLKSDSELRDWFAGMALQGLCAHDGTQGILGSPETKSIRAYELADAMMKAREVKND